MPEQILAESVTFRKLVGHIGEQIAESYLRKKGFEAYVLGDSGMGVMIGDVLLRRKWFHNNGRCEGHWDTLGVEVKTTVSNEFYLQLSQRQKLMHDKHKLPILAIKILGIQPNAIEYEVTEIPSNWGQSQKFASWKGEPTYYDQYAPRPCHKVRGHRINSLEDERRWEERKYLKSVKRIRKELEYIGYSKYIQAGLIKKEELE